MNVATPPSSILSQSNAGCSRFKEVFCQPRRPLYTANVRSSIVGQSTVYYLFDLCDMIACNTRYHPNWQVKDAKLSKNRRPLRQYYSGIPEYIPVRETVYVDRSLCIYIENQMALAQYGPNRVIHRTLTYPYDLSRVSATNIALVYNYAIAPAASRHRVQSHLTDKLGYKDVLDAFFLHSLLRDHKRHQTRLFLPHVGRHRDRLDEALRDRNLRMRYNGQDMWDHACDDCCKILQKDDGTKGMPCLVRTEDVLSGLSSGNHRRCH